MKRYQSLMTVCLSALLAISINAAETPCTREIPGGEKSKKITGSWKIVEENAKQFVVLDADFKTRKGPELKIFSPLPMAAINRNDKVETRGKFVARLKSINGAQRNEIPAELKLEEFRSRVIHCEKYTVVWGGVDLDK